LILGSESPSDGIIRFDGKEIISPDRNRGIVFQKYSLFPHLTILDNIAFGLVYEDFTIPKRIFQPFFYRNRKKEFRLMAEEYLERVGLKDDGDKYPHQLSGGMRQRAAIAQSMIMKPRILLMDEPFGALDDSTRQDMQVFLLEQWKTEKMTVFFVTHDLEEAVFLGSRIIVLSQYYSTDKKENEGSKIVSDLKISEKKVKPLSFKYSRECSDLIKKIRFEGLNPEHRQHIKDFELTHKDSFRTIRDEEWKYKDE
jgi:NitT/TauT family transport system ATP-binding protein